MPILLQLTTPLWGRRTKDGKTKHLQAASVGAGKLETVYGFSVAPRELSSPITVCKFCVWPSAR
jgi:hypothetical protein